MKRSSPHKSRAKKRSTAAGDPYPGIFQPSPFTASSRRKRAKEKRKKALKGWPLRVLTVIAVILILMTLIALLPQFTIESIKVEGTRLTNSEDVSAMAQGLVDRHFIFDIGPGPKQYFSLRYGTLEQEILERFPLIRDVTVKFRFPSTIAIRVDERVEILAVRVSGGFALIDRDHIVLRVAETIDFDLPVLEGISVLSEVIPFEVLDVEDHLELMSAARLTAELIRHDQLTPDNRHLMGLVRQIRQIGLKSFYLFIPLPQGGEIRVKLEDNRLLQEKLQLLSYLIQSGEIPEGVAGELDLSGETAYFRPDTA